MRAERTKGGAAEGSPTLTEPCSGCGSVISRRMTKHPYPAPHPPGSLSRPHGPTVQMPPAARKRSGPGAEVRTAGSSASIRAPVSPTGPPISLSATTLPTKKSNRPHEERVLRAPPSATVRRFHTPEDPERFRPVRMPFPEDRLRAAHRSDSVRRTDDPARLSPATAPARKKKPPTVRNRGERSNVPVIASADRPHFENPA